MKRREIYIYVLLWLLIYAAQLFIFSSDAPRYWPRVVTAWIHLLPFVAAFFINNLLLVPRFLFEKKYKEYIFSALAIILILGIIGSLYRFVTGPLPGSRGVHELFSPLPPGALPKPIHLIIIDNLTFLVLTVGFGTAIKLVFKWLQEEKKRKDIERVQLKTELEMLRQQVSPHFFMNTLNNIHALIDINPDTAKSTIIQLSKLMQYLLYESKDGYTTLLKETEFMRNYIALMRLRFPDKVRIDFNVQEDLPDARINAMLFTSFIENAFKHGISYKDDSFIDISLSVIEGKLIFAVSNSSHDKKVETRSAGSGLGLSNVRKSLDLLYGGGYTLDIIEDEKTFNIKLKIPIYEN